MDWRNRIGLYGSYFLGMAGVGFTLPYLTVFLKDRGFSDLGVGLLATFAALAGLVQFPIGLWSDRVEWRKPFIIVLLAIVAAATLLLYWSREWIWVSFLVLLFAENGACRATVESLDGAEATHMAAGGQLGWALGMLRIWRPAGIILMALAGSLLAGWYGVDSILIPLPVVQILAVVCALFLHEGAASTKDKTAGLPQIKEQPRAHRLAKDCVTPCYGRLWRRWFFSTSATLQAASTSAPSFSN